LVEQAADAQWVLKRNMNRYHELEEAFQDKKALRWSEEEHRESGAYGIGRRRSGRWGGRRLCWSRW
jgi:hypothetical protein